MLRRMQWQYIPTEVQIGVKNTLMSYDISGQLK